MWPNPQETAHFVTFAEEILKLHFLCSVIWTPLLRNLLNHLKFWWRRFLCLYYLNYFYQNEVFHIHCVKSVHIYSFSSPCFPAFRLNTERYSEYGHFSHSDLFRSWFKILCFHCAYIFGELSALSLF